MRYDKMRWIFARPGISLLLHFMRNRREAVFSAMILDFISNIGTILLSLILAQLLAVCSGFQSIRAARLGWGITDVYSLCGLFLLVLTLKFLIDYVRLRLRGILCEDFAAWLRCETMRQFSESKGKLGKIRLSSDMSPAQRLLGRGVLQLGADLSLIFLGLIFLASLHIGLAGIGIAVMLVGGVALRRLNRWVNQAEKERRRQKTKLLHFIDRFPRTDMVLDAAAWRDLGNDYVRKTESVRRYGAAYHRKAAWSEALPIFWAQLLLLAVLWAAWNMGLPAETLFFTVLILMSWRNPLSRLFKADLIWRKGLLSLEKLQKEEKIEKID